MDHFSVLLVDDSSDIRELAESEFPELANSDSPMPHKIRLRTAANEAEAKDLIRDEFFHLALIDPQLQPEQPELSGFFVLEDLKNFRPSCERVILTHIGRQAFRFVEPITLQMHPIDGPAQGLIIKNDPNNFRPLIKQRAKAWLTNPLAVEGADTIADRLREIFQNRPQETLNVAVTADEIDFLVSRVFGQGEPWNLGPDGLGIGKIDLTLIPRQGFSPAVVAKATSYSIRGVAGNQCVLKFAKKEYIEWELARYCQYVRHRLILHHRVELLGCETADNFGVLCYNFASDTSLSDHFLRRNRAFFAAVDDLFSPGKKGWYSERDGRRLSEHFEATYEFKVLNVQGLIRAKSAGLRQRYGASLTDPDDVLSKNVFHEILPACIVHGDLHCDNILVNPDGKPMLIDYYSVATGPLAVDFAVLESSVRLLDLQKSGPDGKFLDDPRSDDEVIPEILEMIKDEVRAWKEVWVGSGPYADPAIPSWETASIHIGCMARGNFPELKEEQYAATCLLWGMRLFKIPSLSDRVRTRLLVWMSCLTEVLKRS